MLRAVRVRKIREVALGILPKFDPGLQHRATELGTAHKKLP